MANQHTHHIQENAWLLCSLHKMIFDDMRPNCFWHYCEISWFRLVCTTSSNPWDTDSVIGVSGNITSLEVSKNLTQTEGNLGTRSCPAPSASTLSVYQNVSVSACLRSCRNRLGDEGAKCQELPFVVQNLGEAWTFSFVITNMFYVFFFFSFVFQPNPRTEEVVWRSNTDTWWRTAACNMLLGLCLVNIKEWCLCIVSLCNIASLTRPY